MQVTLRVRRFDPETDEAPHFETYEVPADPMTGTNQSWKIDMEDALRSVNQTEPGIFDIHSSSDKKSLDGTPYSEW